MPFSSNRELSKSVRDVLPSSAQTIFRNVVNSQLERGLSEARAFASAWSTLQRQGWEKSEGGAWVKKQDEVTIEGTIEKLSPDKQLVFGWASISKTAKGELLVDLQDDVILPEDMEEMAYRFVLEARKAGEMHRRIEGVGTLVESMVFTEDKQKALGIPEGVLPIGWWVGFKLSPEVFEKVKSGEYTMFSIGGRSLSEQID